MPPDGPSAMLVAEGERLAKPCLLLQTEGAGEPVGVWRGDGLTPRPFGYRMEPGRGVRSSHWLTVGCGWLREHGILPFDGLLGVYGREFADGRQDVVAVIHDPGIALAAVHGQPLYGVPAVSFPPLEAVCLHGGPAVEGWLAGQGLRRIDYEAAEGHESDAVQVYREAWWERTPWWSDGADGTAAVLGGWHTMWPEDNFYMPPDIQLAVRTLWDSEPWVEVWRGARNFVTFERVT